MLWIKRTHLSPSSFTYTTRLVHSVWIFVHNFVIPLCFSTSGLKFYFLVSTLCLLCMMFMCGYSGVIVSFL